MLGKLHEGHQHLTDKPAAANGGSGPGAPAAQATRSGTTQADPRNAGWTGDSA
jgi:hypothetical protein